MKVIRIPIIVSLHEDHDSNHYLTDSNLRFQKESEWLLNERDSNPYSTDLNPNSNKGCLDGLIRISIQEIQIPHEEQVKRLKHRFESPTQRFESLTLEL